MANSQELLISLGFVAHTHNWKKCLISVRSKEILLKSLKRAPTLSKTWFSNPQTSTFSIGNHVESWWEIDPSTNVYCQLYLQLFFVTCHGEPHDPPAFPCLYSSPSPPTPPSVPYPHTVVDIPWWVSLSQTDTLSRSLTKRYRD